MQLSLADSPISLDSLATRIRKSSNFRFEWQFYQYESMDAKSPTGIRQALDTIIATTGLHEFLRISFDPMYADAFEIQPLHEHCQILHATSDFESILAQAANDRLGAYSQIRRQANDREMQKIRNLFGDPGEYHGFNLIPGTVSGCPACVEYNNHLFSTWFYGVAWDWCLFASWPNRNLLWMGCLTDTD